MPKSRKTSDVEPTGLKIRTLSGVFESSRTIEALLPMAITSTTQQLQKRLLAISKNKEQLMTLFIALSRLQEASAELGDTTLVAPTLHPLVERVPFPRPVA